MLETRYVDRNWRDHEPAEKIGAFFEELDEILGDGLNYHETPSNALPDWFAQQIDRRASMTDAERRIDDQRRNAQSRADDLEGACADVADKLSSIVADLRFTIGLLQKENDIFGAQYHLNDTAAKLDHAERMLRDAIDPPAEEVADAGDSLADIEGRELDRIHAAQVGGMNRMAM